MAGTGRAESGQTGQDAVIERSRRFVVADAGLGLLRRARSAGQDRGVDDLGERLGGRRGRNGDRRLLEPALDGARSQQLA